MISMDSESGRLYNENQTKHKVAIIQMVRNLLSMPFFTTLTK